VGFYREDYASNFTAPWSPEGLDVSSLPLPSLPAFLIDYTIRLLQVYDAPDALNPEAPADPTSFLNSSFLFYLHLFTSSHDEYVYDIDAITRAALHAPTSKDWALQFNYPFEAADPSAVNAGNEFGDPSVP